VILEIEMVVGNRDRRPVNRPSLQRRNYPFSRCHEPTHPFRMTLLLCNAGYLSTNTVPQGTHFVARRSQQ
jgi:hypothetical protein